MQPSFPTLLKLSHSISTGMVLRASWHNPGALFSFWPHLRLLVPGAHSENPGPRTARKLPRECVPESHDPLKAKFIISLKNVVGVWVFLSPGSSMQVINKISI